MSVNEVSPLKKTRDSWFDNAKAFLIVNVVIGHLAYGGFSTTTYWVIALQKFIYIYHMPAFMIITGRFARKRIDNNDWVTVVEKSLLPYLLLQTLMLVFYSAFGKSGAKFNYFVPLFGLWYLFNVAVYGLVTPTLKKCKWLFPLSVLAMLGVGFAFGELYGGFARIVTMYPYFLFGYYTSKYDFNICKKIPFRILSYLAFIGLGLFVLIYNKDISYSMLTNNKTYLTIAEPMGWRVREAFAINIIRYLLGFAFFFVIMGMVPSKKTFYSYLGTNSTYVYVLHLFIIIALRSIDGKYDILSVLTDRYRLLLYCFSGVPLAFILASKPVRKLTRFIVEPDINLKRMWAKVMKTDK